MKAGGDTEMNAVLRYSCLRVSTHYPMQPFLLKMLKDLLQDDRSQFHVVPLFSVADAINAKIFCNPVLVGFIYSVLIFA